MKALLRRYLRKDLNEGISHGRRAFETEGQQIKNPMKETCLVCSRSRDRCDRSSVDSGDGIGDEEGNGDLREN